MYNICQNTVILVIFILCWRERYLLNIIKLKAKETRIPERRIHQNIVGIFLWYNMSQGVQNSISVPLDRCVFGGQNIMPTLSSSHATTPAGIVGSFKFAVATRCRCSKITLKLPEVAGLFSKAAQKFLVNIKTND